MRQIVLSPSDFGYLFRDCKRCTWLKLRHGIKLPDRPMAGMFSKVDSYMKHLVSGPNFMELLGYKGFIPANIPDKLESVPFSYAPLGVELVLRGKPDKIFHNPATGEHIIFENKMSEPKADTYELYQNQQAAYALMLGYPAKSMKIEPVENINRVVLCCFDPYTMVRATDMVSDSEIQASLRGKITLHEEAPNFEKLATLMEAIAMLCSSDQPPAVANAYRPRKKVYEITCSSCNFFLQLLTLDPLTLKGISKDVELLNIEAPQEEAPQEPEHKPVPGNGPKVIPGRRKI